MIIAYENHVEANNVLPLAEGYNRALRIFAPVMRQINQLQR
ncbi:MAG: hypothetical protein O2971_19625 [Proteobacteria bacterium]|nr:hypothetical protein [Pseudomonadota bacterium]